MVNLSSDQISTNIVNILADLHHQTSHIKLTNNVDDRTYDDGLWKWHFLLVSAMIKYVR